MVRINEGRVLIINEREHKIRGCAWRSRKGAGFWIYYNTCMPPSGRVCNSTHFRATRDDIHNPLRSGLCGLVIVACIVLSECVLGLVREQVLEMSFLEEVGNLEA